MEKEYKTIHQEWEVASSIAQTYRNYIAKISDGKFDGVDIDDWVALNTLESIPKKYFPEKEIREIRKDFRLPEEKVEKSYSGYELK